MSGAIKTSRKRKALEKNKSNIIRQKRWEDGHEADLKEIELWKQLALELSELKKR